MALTGVGRAVETRTIRATDKAARTGLRVEEGGRYRFRTSGTWKDAWIVATPAGFERWWLRAFTPLRRLPEAPWFALCAHVDGAADRPFAIGGGLDEWHAPASGELVCFANDVPFLYGNNSGEITLQVSRI